MELVKVLRDKKIYPCTFDGCSSVFDRPYRLAQHQLVHANVKPFVCDKPMCEKAYTSKSHLVRHIKTAHKEGAELDVLYCCPICMKKYANRQNLKRHIKVSHIYNNKPFCCSLCKVYFKKKHQLKAHMFVHNGLKPFRCPMCDRDFLTLYEKKKHMKNHKSYNCEHCETKFTRWTELMLHKRVNHMLPEYVCHDCGQAFKERGHIIRHVKKHMPNAPINIFFCPYDNCCRHYSRNSNLKQHILVKHQGLTFDCSLCGSKLSTKAKLKEHIDRHNRPELSVKAPKTLKTGRKKRKDAGTIRYETAMRLAGIVNQKVEDGISRLNPGSITYKDHLKQCTSNVDNDIHRGNLKNSNLIVQGDKTILQDDVKFGTKVSTVGNEIKVDYNSNESTNNPNKEEKAISKPPENAKEIRTLSSPQKEGKRPTTKPTNLIEILNRPVIRIDHSEETNTSEQIIDKTTEYIEVKLEADSNNETYMNTQQTGVSSHQVIEIPIKVEQVEENSDINENVPVEANLPNSASNHHNMQSSVANNALSCLLQLYWKTISNYQDV